VGSHHGQETGRKRDFDSSTKSGPSAQDRYCSRGLGGGADFLTKSSWVLCPVNAVRKNFPRISAQNLLLVINELMNELIN